MSSLTFYDYLNALEAPVIIPCLKLEWLNPDDTVSHEITTDLYNTNGTLNITNQNGCRRTFNLQIHNDDGRYDIDVNKIWLGQKVKLYLGLYIGDTPYLIQQGVFYITNPTDIMNTAERCIQLNCTDKWAYLDGSLFGTLDGIYKVPVGSDIFDATKKLLMTDRGNGLPLDSTMPNISTYFNKKMTSLSNGTQVSVLETPFTATIERGQSYADVLLQFNTMLAGCIYYDTVGRLNIEPNEDDLEDKDKEIVYNFTQDNCEILGKSRDYQFTEVYNDILCVGATINGYMASGRATNTNIQSDLCVQRIGKKTKVFEDTNYYTDDLCQDWANYLLRQNTILQSSLNITTIPMYHLDVNKLITITNEKNHLEQEKFLINSLSIPLGIGQMSMSVISVNELDAVYKSTQNSEAGVG
jgi:hypothetical protein